MRLLLLALCASLLLPAAAANGDSEAPVRVLWNSTPDNLRAHGTWEARLSVLKGPGGFDEGGARPVLVVTELSSGAERRVLMSLDVPPNTFKAPVTFPRAGTYLVAAIGFDPSDRARRAGIGHPIRIEASPAARAGTSSWPWAVVVAVLLAGASSVRARAIRRSRQDDRPAGHETRAGARRAGRRRQSGLSPRDGEEEGLGAAEFDDATVSYEVLHARKNGPVAGASADEA